MHPRRVLSVLSALATSLVLVPGAVALATPADAAAGSAVVTRSLRLAVRALPVAGEVRRGYDRDRFRHWVDADSDGCDTRDEVLIAEARTAPSVGPDCRLVGGRWFSYYDGVGTSSPSTFDVDHMVPLAEAWDSGARRWDASTRTAFANDLGDRRSLVAVTASSNRSKSDQDPAEWLPRRRVRCRYVAEWVAVKTRWQLSVDRTEKRTLARLALACPDVTVRVRRAPVTLR